MHCRSLFKLNYEESLSRFGDCYWCFNQARLLVRPGKYNSLSVSLLKNPLVPDKRTSVDVEPCDVCLDCFGRLGPIFTTPLLHCVSGVVRQFFLVFCPFNS